MRIALDATYSVDPHPSGIAVYSSELLRGLTEQHPDDVFTFCYRFKQFRRARPLAFHGNVRKRLLGLPFPPLRADIFHALNQRVDKRPACAVISTFHDLFVITGEYSSPAFRARFTHQAQQAAANSDLLIAVSEFTASQIRALLQVSPDKIRVIPHGVRLPEGRAPGVDGRGKIILFVGALQLRKNVSRLVRAFEAVPTDWRLVLVGATNGFGAQQILAHIKASSAHERIEVRGYVPDRILQNLYRTASIFAFPSLDEGFGLPVLDAMAQGVPVLTSNRSATAEVARNAAILVDPFADEAIAAGLLELINKEDLRHALAERGHARAREHSWVNACAATYRVYSELVRSPA